MSTNSECQFIEVKPNEWFYLLEHENAPENSSDWRESATAYGPFLAFENAERHLRGNHANPGGFSKLPYKAGFDLSKDPVLEKLIKQAQERKLPRH